MSAPRDPVASGLYRPEDFPEVDVAAEQEVTAGIERLRTLTYTGRDQEHLVTAVVDGDGVVTRIRFAATAVTRTPEVLERAVVAAVAAAQQRMDEAWRAVAARALPSLAPPVTAESYGGIEMAFDPATDGVEGGTTDGRA